MDLSAFGRHGALPRPRAAALFGEHQVRRALESGLVTAVWAGVLVDPARTADPLTLSSAALHLAGLDGVLTGPTAAYLHGCTAAEATPIHVVVPYGHWLRSQPGLVVHNGRDVDADRMRISELPVLGLERVVSDLLCSASPPEAFAVLDQCLALASNAEATRKRLDERLACRVDPRGVRRAAAMLAVATGRVRSPAESWMFWHLVDQGFPPPEVNWWLRGPDGAGVFELDLAWPELRIVVEYDGWAAHAGREGHDAARQRELERRGWVVLRARAEDLREPRDLAVRLDAAFRSRGVALRRATGGLRGRRHRESGLGRRRGNPATR
ncbi:MAG: DUF559 domain-containing protein [Pseudonocardia sp.]|nr:DUF559 domain-containing protein [Pseudonocardia sp.]